MQADDPLIEDEKDEDEDDEDEDEDDDLEEAQGEGEFFLIAIDGFSRKSWWSWNMLLNLLTNCYCLG